MKKCAGIFGKFIAAVGTVLFLILTIYAWRYTMKVDLYSEGLADVKDTAWRGALLFLIAVELVCRLGTWKKYLTPKRVHILAVIVSVGVAVISCKLVMDAHSVTGTDQLHLYMVAEDIESGSGERFASGYDYFFCFPNQLGMGGIYAAVMHIAGHSQDVLRYLQSFCAGLTAYLGFLITRQLSDDRRAEIMYLLGMSCFLPLYLYTMFVYGETIGVCAMFACVWTFLRAQEAQGRRRYVYWAVLALGMIIMYSARQGLIVVGIAMLMVQILIWLNGGEKKALFLMACALLLMIVGQKAIIKLSESRMDADFGKGAPAVSWIAMGMQVHENEDLPPGYYNGYQVQVFKDAGLDTDKAAEISRAYIRERLTYWGGHPGEMLRFYKGKILGQWNEPTYHAFIMTNLMEEPEDWIYDLYWGDVRRDWDQYLNAFQSVVYLLVFASFVLLFMGKRKPQEYLLGLILLGGFFFSVIWETKSRYIYPYSVVMIPCAVISLAAWCDRIYAMAADRAARRNEKQNDSK